MKKLSVKEVEGWEVTFDERWNPCYIGQVGEGGAEVSSYIKDFISSSIERARREEQNKQILGYEKGQREERQRVVEMVEGMYPYEEIEKFKGMDYMEIVQEVKLDLKSKLGDAK